MDYVAIDNADDALSALLMNDTQHLLSSLAYLEAHPHPQAAGALLEILDLINDESFLMAENFDAVLNGLVGVLAVYGDAIVVSVARRLGRGIVWDFNAPYLILKKIGTPWVAEVAIELFIAGQIGASDSARLIEDVGTVAVPIMLRYVNHRRYKVRQLVAWVLGQLRDLRATDALIQLMGDDSAEVRRRAALGVGRLRDERGVAGLCTLLCDRDYRVAETALEALGLIGHPSALGAVRHLLGDEKRRDLWGMAIITLGQVGGKAVIGDLCTILHKTPHEWLKTAALRALGKIGGYDAALFDLIVLLDSDSQRIRDLTVRALRQVKSPMAVEALARAALKDKDPWIQRLAIEALAEIPHPTLQRFVYVWRKQNQMDSDHGDTR